MSGWTCRGQQRESEGDAVLKIKLVVAVIGAELAVLGWVVGADLWAWCLGSMGR